MFFDLHVPSFIKSIEVCRGCIGKEISEPIKSEQFINFIPITDVCQRALGFFLWRANIDPLKPASEHYSVVNAFVDTTIFSKLRHGQQLGYQPQRHLRVKLRFMPQSVPFTHKTRWTAKLNRFVKAVQFNRLSKATFCFTGLFAFTHAT